MSQVLVEKKIRNSKKLSGLHRIMEAILIVGVVFAVYMMVALLSFDPTDPSWSQASWHDAVKNITGSVGAWIADALFLSVGALAYTIPPILVIAAWVLFRRRSDDERFDFLNLALRLIGIVLLIGASCGLAAISVDDFYYFPSGGFIGAAISDYTVPWFSRIGATLILLCVWAAAVTLFTGLSWLTLAENIGSAILNPVAFITNGARSRKQQAEDDEFVADDDVADLPPADEDDILLGKQEPTIPPMRPLSAYDEESELDAAPTPSGNSADKSQAATPANQPQHAQPVAAAAIAAGAATVAPAGQAAASSAMTNAHATVPYITATNTTPSHSVAQSLAANNAPAVHSPVTRKPTVSFSAADDEQGSDYTPVSMFTDANNNANANSANNSVPAHHAVHQSVSVNANSEINPAASQDANDDNWFEPKIDFAGLDDLIKQEEPVNPRAAESSSAPAHQSNQAAGMSTSAFSRKPASVDAAFDVDDVLPSFGAALADDPFMPASGSASAGLQAASLAGMVAAGAASAATSAPAAAATASAVAGGATAFGLGDSSTSSDTETSAARPQVKPNVPEMPRPNPVKIPTRRTLASLGIKLPSERMAEQREREMLEQREREQAERQRAEEALAKEKSLIPGVEIPSFFNALEDDTSAFSFSARDDEPQVSVRPASAAAESNAADAASEITPAMSTSPVSPAANAAASSYADRGAQVAEDDDEDSRMPSFSAIQDDRDESVANERFAADAQADDDETDEDAQFNARLRAEFEAREQERLARAVEVVRRPLQTETSALVRPQTSREPVAPTHATSNPMTHTAAPFTFEPVREEPSMDDSVNDVAADEPAAPHAFASKPSTSSVSAFMPATESAAAFTPAGKAEPEQDDANDEANSEQQFHAAEIMRMRKRAEQEHMAFLHPFLMPQEDVMPKPTTPLPTLDLLAEPPRNNMPVSEQELEMTARLVEARLNDYRIKADVAEISPGPVITRFELDLAPGVKAARISNLSRDLARALSTTAVRVVEVIPGKSYVGLELPNKDRQTVYLREVLDCDKFRQSASPLTVVLGKDIAGDPVIADLAKMPHLLVAGTTGSGKSVGVNAMILSILYKATPDEVRFIMIDPKMLELSVYEGIPHLLTEVVTDMKDAANALRWCVGEMERRYKLMSLLGVRNISGYNDRVVEAEKMGQPIPDPLWRPGDSMEPMPPALTKLPYIVVMVDEFADLMMVAGKKIEELIARLAQKARAAGIHLVLATQRPSVDVITGLIKANIPTRIAFTVSSKIDSRTILDQSGAESLLGMGDMLYLPPNSSIPERVHGAFVRDQEVHAVAQDWKARGRPQYIDAILAGDSSEGGNGYDNMDEELDALFDQAVQFVTETRRGSVSGVQRKFKIGYNRAARIIEQMEAQGIVSAPGHNGNREVLAPPPIRD